MKTKTPKFTPGPWYVDGRMVSINPNISVCAMVDFDSFGGHIPAHNCEANAHLIAAAPDLLAALEKLAAYGDPTQDVTVEICWEDVEQARAALAKAKGHE